MAFSGSGAARARVNTIEQLLPGIPDHITLDLITPKVSWKDLRSLASVSRRWRDSIESREAYEARARLHSTETLVLVTYRVSTFSRVMALYSLTENRRYELPPIPQLEGRTPPNSQCVTLDGKIYILGGGCDPGRDRGHDNAPGSAPGVYVLDLAGKIQWKQCASMIETRVRFGCGVINGKIYVFGGLGRSASVCGSEVYDPTENTWSPIKAMTRLRFEHEVATVGTQLFLYGGKVLERGNRIWRSFDLEWANADKTLLEDPEKQSSAVIYEKKNMWKIYLEIKHLPQEDSLELYDPVKDEWTSVETVGSEERGEGSANLFFIAKGKLHTCDDDHIYVHDIETNRWTHLHDSVVARGTVKAESINGKTALLVDDQILVIADEVEETDHDFEVRKACLFRSRGLGSREKEINWERAQFPICYEKWIDTLDTDYSMHPVQL